MVNAYAARDRYMDRTDVQITHEEEVESYASVYGEEPPEGAEFCCVVVRIGGEVVASLGFVDCGDADYLRTVENELLAEAFEAEQHAAEATEAALRG